jgi:predicted HicB family RNase H-like nuclease
MPSYTRHRPTKIISVRMPATLQQRIVAAAASEGKSLNAFAIETLERAMADR